MKTQKSAITIAGKLSVTSKMPCDSWGIPASLCKVGSKMAKQEGSTCFDCYALKGAYIWTDVHKAYQKRYDLYKEHSSSGLWVEAMVLLIQAQAKRRKTDFFRFFDSGDLQDLGMLENLVKICCALPNVKFWLPTREKAIVLKFIKTWGENAIPSNLVIRISDYFIDMRDKMDLFPNVIKSSSVGKAKLAITCPSSAQHGQCGDCRKCWNPDIENITYKQH